MSCFFSSIVSSHFWSYYYTTLYLQATVIVTVTAVYAPTEPSDPSVENKFYENLQNLIDSIPNSHSILLAGDFNAQNGTDTHSFPDVSVNFGTGNVNNKLVLMLSFITAKNLKLPDS